MVKITDSTISSLKRLKQLIDKRGANGFSLYKEAKSLGFTLADVNALRKLKVIDKTNRQINNRHYGYSWNEKYEPTVQLFNNMSAKADDLGKEAYQRKLAKDKRGQGQLEFEKRPEDKVISTEQDSSDKSEGKPEIKAETTNPVPIEVTVTTVGNRKTVTIKIEV